MYVYIKTRKYNKKMAKMTILEQKNTFVDLNFGVI